MASKSKLRPYTNYIFKGGKDPVIDKVLTIMDDSGLSRAEIHRRSNVSTSTIRGWEIKTRRPQFCTIESAARACGKTLVFTNFRH